MPQLTIRSLDGVDHPFGEADEMPWRDLASKLNREGTKVIERISRAGLINLSKWMTYMNKEAWEVGVAQDFKTRKLRLIKGDKSKDFNVAAKISAERLRPNEFIIVHVHPIFQSNRNHFDKDRKGATAVIEGVLDWSNCLICYDANTVYNPYVAGSGGRLESAEAMYRKKGIPFLSCDDIVGYSHFDKENHVPIFENPFNV
jgi:hypothetical protein